MRDQCLQTVAVTTDVPAATPRGAATSKRVFVFAVMVVFTALTSEGRILPRGENPKRTLILAQDDFSARDRV